MLSPTRSRPSRKAAAALAAMIAATGLAACGSGSSSGSGGSGSNASAASSNPQTLLRQTFAQTHSVKSGVLRLSLVITPKGSSVVTTPLTFTLDGPFQSRGGGKTPESAFTLAFSGLGKHGSFGVTTTSTGSYVTLEGASYQLPASDFKKLQSGLGSSSGSAPGFSSLGIDPEKWLRSPQIVGTATVDGVTTEHLRSAVDVPAVIDSVNTLLAKEASTIKSQAGVAAPHISPSEAAKVAAAIKHPTVDVYTGKSDSTLRRMEIAASVPVTGTTSTQLGGMTSASFRMTLDYSKLGTPQTISAPSHPRSYAQLQTKLQSIGAQLEGALGGGTGMTGSSGSTGSGGSSGQVSRYSRCINSAKGDVAKMQRCAKDLNSGG